MKNSTVMGVLRSTRVRSAFLVLLAAFILGMVKVIASSGNAPRPLSQKLPGGLTMDERTAYQRAIEAVYWQHRIWPKENSKPKPPFDEVTPLSELRAKVEDYLRMTSALETHWQRPITGQQLQAEIDRMATQTKQPDLLKELWAALGNNPYVIAECLARPVLADRLARNWYAFDERFHGDLKAQAEGGLSQHRSAAQMRELGGAYRESEWALGESTKSKGPQSGSEVVSADEWNARGYKLAQVFAKANREPGPPGAQAWLNLIPVSELSDLQESEDAFYVVAVLDKGKDRIRLASVEWRKEPFDAWWSKAGTGLGMGVAAASVFNYSLKPIAPAAGTDVWDSIVSSAPNGRNNHSAVWTGSEMIIWGGSEFFNCCNTTYSNGGGRYFPATDTWVLTSTLNAPTPRGYHTAVWTGTQMIVWGGQDFSNRYNTGGRYDLSTNSWTGLNTAGAPSPRLFHTAVWTGSEMIVWGGADNGSCCSSTGLNTGARYNPTTDSWTATSTPLAPSGRGGHTAVWTGSGMIVWGGTTNPGSSSNVLNTGGRYNPSNNTWTGTNTAGAPPARSSHTAVWSGSEMIIWGGSTVSCCSGNNTGGKYNPATDSWALTTTVGAPEGRQSHTAVWAGSVMIIWGGNNSLNSGGRYNPGEDSWTATSLSNAPSGRSGHTAVWTGIEMIIWGGNNFGTPNNTGGRYNPSANSWTATSTSIAPSGRERHTTVWTGSEMIVWGGYSFANSTASILNTGGRYNSALDAWTPTNTSNPPTARYGHTAVWTGTEVIEWGGYDGTSVVNTGGRYNPATNIWTATDSGGPGPRYQHTAVWSGSEMIVWGGSDGFNYFNTGGRYNPSAHTWSVTDTLTAPSARDNHTAIWSGSEMIVWGGYNSGAGNLNSGGRYTPGSNSWTATNLAGAPGGRINHTAVWTGSEMIVWGGSDGANQLNTGGRYTPGGNNWSLVNPIGAPTARSNHTAVWTGIEMVVWGGFDGLSYFNTGSRYDPSVNGWAVVNPVNAPSERYRHSAVWTGNEMIVWSGFDGTNYLNTGGRYIAPLGPLCAYSISPRSSFCTPVGMECEINVTAGNTCSWAAVSDAAWITITSDTGGIGNGTVTIVVRDNLEDVPRTGTLTIAGQTFTLVQDSSASPDCLYTVSPSFVSVSAAGGSGSFQVSAEERCAWGAASSVSWITITSNSSGIGSGTVSYTVDANPSTAGRKGTITVAGQTFSVKQKGS
jgi:N-acetylneuraminic acid mutarotase